MPNDDAIKVVPTLTTNGWVKGTAEKVDFLMAYFFETDPRQSYIFAGTVTSMQAIIAEAGHDMGKLASKASESLTGYFNRYFDSSRVTVTTNEVEFGSNRMELRIHIQVTDAGKDYSVGQILREMNGRFARVVATNNDGTY